MASIIIVSLIPLTKWPKWERLWKYFYWLLAQINKLINAWEIVEIFLPAKDKAITSLARPTITQSFDFQN
jgi:hypothetical protein